MRIFIAVLVLIFSFQSWTKADDISDFEIEGMSIGDSLLDYFSKSTIDESVALNPQYPKEDFKISWFNKTKNGKKFFTYDGITIYFKNKKYSIHGITGSIYFKYFKNCSKKKKSIINDLENSLNIKFGIEQEVKLFTTSDDSTMMYGNVYTFPSGATIQITCYDWSQDQEKIGRKDELALAISDHEYHRWMDSISDLY